MGVRRPRAWARARLTVSAGSVAAAAILLAAAAGCGSPASSAASTSAAGPTVCGTTRTAANVPVHIQIAHGRVSCATALSVERAYARAIESGQVPGTGGGAPVRVSGWTCQGFTTPVVLKTGQASKCVQGGSEILAVLPPPS